MNSLEQENNFLKLMIKGYREEIEELEQENEKLSKEVDMWNTKYNEVFDENEKLKGNNQSMQEEMCRTWEKLDKLNHNWNELKKWLEERYLRVDSGTDFEIALHMTLDIMQEIEGGNNE